MSYVPTKQVKNDTVLTNYSFYNRIIKTLLDQQQAKASALAINVSLIVNKVY